MFVLSFFVFVWFSSLSVSLFSCFLFLRLNLQVGAVNIDSSWQTGYNSLQWNTKLYPNAYVFSPASPHSLLFTSL